MASWLLVKCLPLTRRSASMGRVRAAITHSKPAWQSFRPPFPAFPSISFCPLFYFRIRRTGPLVCTNGRILGIDKSQSPLWLTAPLDALSSLRKTN